MSDDEFCELILDLSAVDPAALEPAVRRQEARGVAFATLAEEQTREPAWLALFCDLENETRRGIDGPRSVEQMAERLAFLKVVPEALFVAKRRGYRCIVTSPRVTNLASIRTNEAVGFRTASGVSRGDRWRF